MRYLAVLAAMLVFAASASARPPSPVPTPAPPAAPASPSATSPSTGGGVLGSPDTTESLGGTDANCHHLQGASAVVIRNCRASGLAESASPPSNFGTDTHVDTGITDPGNDMASIAQEVLGGLYSIIAQVLTWILLGLGLAFGFDLFAQDHSGKVAHGLTGATALFSSPLIPVAFLIGAAIGMFYWVSQRAEGRAVAHWTTMVALTVAALIIASNPVGIFGWLDDASNKITSGALAAFTGQGGGGSGAGFANAVPGIYKTTMEEPWCAMEFGNVNWCMGSIDPAMAKARDDIIAHHLPDALGSQGSRQLALQQAPFERMRLLAARTNGELFLSFVPNSDARNGKNDSWTLYSVVDKEHPELLAIRGSGGVWQHFGIFVLSSVAGIFFFILLLYVAWQLIVASVFFVFCLLLAPVMALVGALGHHKGFFAWFVLMVESLAKRVIFAIYLGIVLLVSQVFFSLGGAFGGWLIQWLVLAGIWAMAFLYRHKLLDLISFGAYKSHAHPGATFKAAALAGAGAYAWKKAPQRVAAVHHHEHAGDSVVEDHRHVHFDGWDDGRDSGREPPEWVPNGGGPRPPDLEGSVRELGE